MTIPVSVTPAGAAGAYARVQSGAVGGVTGPAGGPSGAGFGDALARAMQGVVDTGHQADAKAMQAIGGGGNLTEVVTAVSQAELALQSAVAIRDRVVQAYQDVMRMPIYAHGPVGHVQPGQGPGGMDDAGTAAALRDALLVAMKLGGPPLLAMLAVGLVISLVQAVTQVNEATLVFLPKVLVLGGMLVLTGPFMVATLQDFARTLMDQLVQVGGR